MFEKFMAVVLFICSAIMMIVGIAHDPPWVLHILLGFLAFAGATAILMDYMARNAPFYDEETKRYYRFANKTDRLHHLRCPRCDEWSRIIYTTSNSDRNGVYCHHHGPVWFDLEPLCTTGRQHAVREKAG
jgi:hypothetical protein